MRGAYRVAKKSEQQLVGMLEFASTLLSNWRIALGLFLLSSLCSAANARECNATVPNFERILCEKPELSKLDDTLNVAYRAAVARSDASEILKADQRWWLEKVRDTCDTYECIQQAYEQQIDHWRSMLSFKEIEKRYGGKYVRYFSHKADRDRNPADLTIHAAPGARLSVKGSALWVQDITGDIHDGKVDGVASFRYAWRFVDGLNASCSFSLDFTHAGLNVSNDNENCGGAAVSFNGYYRKMQ